MGFNGSLFVLDLLVAAIATSIILIIVYSEDIVIMLKSISSLLKLIIIGSCVAGGLLICGPLTYFTFK